MDMLREAPQRNEQGKLLAFPPPALDDGARWRRKRAPGGGFKRLIVCCDGTWLNSDDGLKNGELAIPSNVTRLARAIKPVSQDGIAQVVYYHFGVGSQGGFLDRVVMGATGEGLAENVREAYSFLANNYAPGDEIFLTGFSRGAYTARAVAGMISSIGLLTKRGMPSFAEIFRDVQNRRNKRYKPKNPNVPWPNKPSAGDPRYRDELFQRGLTDLDVRVKAIGVWDTVGSLGLPRISSLVKLGLETEESREMRFYDTKLSDSIENAFQALALDERRTAFSPAVWEKPRGNTTVLRQVWFPGVHSNIGGGYDDQELANITLAWMMSQLGPFLDMYPDYITEQAEANAYYYASRHRRRRPWSFGEIYNSMAGIYALGGGTTRTPGTYYAVDAETGRETDRPLRDTNEYIHASVRTRFVLRGRGLDDKGRYDPPALDDWRLVVEYPGGGGGGGDGPHGPPGFPPFPNTGHGHGHGHVAGAAGPEPRIYWKARFENTNVSTRVLPEAPLWDVERRLLARDPQTEAYVLRPDPTRIGGGGERPERRDRREREGNGQLAGRRPRDSLMRPPRERERSRSRSRPALPRDRERSRSRSRPAPPRYRERDRDRRRSRRIVVDEEPDLESSDAESATYEDGRRRR